MSSTKRTKPSSPNLTAAPSPVNLASKRNKQNVDATMLTLNGNCTPAAIKQEANSPLQRRINTQQNSNNANIKRKLTIKPFAVQPTVPHEYEANTLRKLHAAVEYILGYTIDSTDEPSINNQEELYRSVESLCKYKKSSDVYNQLYTQMQHHVGVMFDGIAEVMSKVDGAQFLNVMERSWRLFSKQITIIRSIYLYLDRTYIIAAVALNEQYQYMHDVSVRSIWDLALVFWRYSMHNVHHNIEAHIVTLLLQYIESDRNNETIPKTQVKVLCNMLVQLKLYKFSFEPTLIDGTTKYYHQKSAQYIIDLNITDYLQFIHSVLHNEKQRVTDYLDVSTSKVLMHTVEQCVIAKHADKLLHSGFHTVFAANKFDDLKLFYTYFTLIDATALLKKQWESECRTLIEQCLNNHLNDKQAAKQSIVTQLFDIKAKLDNIITQCFAGHTDYSTIVQTAFESLINKPQYKISEELARYINNIYRRAVTDIDTQFNQIIYLFRLLTGKDIFLEFYRGDLSKRLLLKSATFNEKNELKFIGLLKNECGVQYVQRLHNMFVDIANNATVNNQFRQFVAGKADESIEWSTQILTTGNWPNYNHFDIKLNDAGIQQYYTLFSEFYQNQYSGRVLKYVHHLSTVSLRAHFATKVKELQCSLVQFAVLSLFNTQKELTYQQILDMTQCTDEKDLQLNLVALVNPKVKILNKVPLTAKFEPNHTFTVNMQFISDQFRVTLNTQQGRETKTEQTATEKKVLDDRQYAVDAAIVRIMKSKKQMTHNQLMAEAMTMIKFPVSVIDLKKRIGSLIEREYMERDKDDATMYIYQA